jgi:hypothetical protein
VRLISVVYEQDEKQQRQHPGARMIAAGSFQRGRTSVGVRVMLAAISIDAKRSSPMKPDWHIDA